MLYYFFLGDSRRLNFMCRRFGTSCLFRLHRSCVYSSVLKMVAIGLAEQRFGQLDYTVSHPIRWQSSYWPSAGF